MLSTVTRYAIYFAPPTDSTLWRFGSALIGYDAATGEEVRQHVPPGIAPRVWRALTEEPRRYGFHATLKAPFQLADGVSESDLLAEVGRVAASANPFEVELEVARLGGVVALIAPSPPPALAALERMVVMKLDRCRAPLNDAEVARRLRAPLTPRQRALLDEFGYPYVLDEFRFHMSLTGLLPADDKDGIAASLADTFAALDIGSVAINRLAVFREDLGRFSILSAHDFS